MKKAIWGICLAVVCLMSCCAAHAQESAAFSILRGHLLARGSGASTMSGDMISAIAADLTQNGYSVSAQAYGEDAHVYDVTMDILESILGDYYDWSIEDKHGFDQLMVDCGELAYCHNLLPGDGELAQEDALRIALSEIENRFSPGQALLEQPSSVTTSYYLADRSSQRGKWRFGIDLTDEMGFAVEVTDGVVTQCEQVVAIDDLEEEYIRLCDQRGAFFKWSLQEKMEFADILPQKLADARARDALLMSDIVLEAIAAYGFCLPTDDALSQEAAHAAASAAMAQTFGIAADDCAETYYSFFYQKEQGYVWRVIFWRTGHAEHTSVIVDMRAETGEVLSIRSNGSTASEYIPYVERL